MIFKKSTPITASILGLLLLFQVGCKSSETITNEGTPPGVFVSPSPVYATEYDENTALFSQYPIREFRAAWVATVANIDWPSKPGLTVEQQKSEFITLLNRAVSLNLNAIILQVRPAADAFYDSPYEPWSGFLTGTMGQSPLPAYDPLEFAIHEAHKRGLELHAWFNPYRAGHPSDSSKISADHISKTNPEYVHEFGNFLWLDPGLPEVKEHTMNVVLDVVRRYDIDGVHFDDYFYPYPSYADNAEFPDSLAWQSALKLGSELSRADWRRENVNSLMRDLYQRIKEIKPHVKFGISPFGIWRPGHPSFTNGFDAYTELYADAKLWLNEGWLDYITPQIYYQMGQPAQPFPVMLNWWSEQNLHNRHLWPGLYTSRLWTPGRTWTPDELLGQIYTSRAFPGVTGTVHFSMKTFLQNSAGINLSISAGPYARQALIPPSPWIASVRPDKPELTVYDYGDFWKAALYTNQPDDVFHWILRLKYDHGLESWVYPGHLSEISFYGGMHLKRPARVYLSAVNRAGIESDIDVAKFSQQKQNRPSQWSGSNKIVPRSEWSKKLPAGVDANAIRKNVSYSDTLRFHDLTMIIGRMMRSMAFPGRLLKVDPGDPDEDDEVRNTVSFELYRNATSETITMQPGESRNWYGFHISLLNLDFAKSLAEFEIATTASLPASKVSTLKTGNSDQRYKIRHTPNRIAIDAGTYSSDWQIYSNTTDFLNNQFEKLTRQKNWWDLPYHFYIDKHGQIFEGRDRRYSGESLSRFDPRGTIMIQLIPDQQHEHVPKLQKDALIYLISKLILKDDMPINQIYPLGDLDTGKEPNENIQSLIRNGTLHQLIIQNIGNQVER